MKKKNIDLEKSQVILRKSLGILALIFPFALLLASFLDGTTNMLPTLSDSYWTNAHGLFIGMLIVVGVFLLSYRGYDKTDNVITEIAGIGLILTALIPMEGGTNYLLFFLPEVISNILHHAFAIISFTLLGVMSFTQFVKGQMNANKKKRNKIYKACGLLIFICVGLMIPTKLIIGTHTTPIFFILESIVVIAFGISWLVKGQTLFKDQ